MLFIVSSNVIILIAHALNLMSLNAILIRISNLSSDFNLSRTLHVNSGDLIIFFKLFFSLNMIKKIHISIIIIINIIIIIIIY